MPLRPYSFKYQYDIQTALLPWRAKLGDDNYEQVVQLLVDRDRLLEDHLNLSVGQGYLGTASVTSNQTGLGVSAVDLTNLSVTVNVPANRRLIITAHVRLQNLAGSRGIGTLNVQESSTVLGSRITGLLEVSGAIGDAEDREIVVFVTPTAGVHTYKLTAAMSTGNGQNVAFSTNPSYITVEDIGPTE